MYLTLRYPTRTRVEEDEIERVGRRKRRNEEEEMWREVRGSRR